MLRILNFCIGINIRYIIFLKISGRALLNFRLFNYLLVTLRKSNISEWDKTIYYPINHFEFYNTVCYKWFVLMNIVLFKDNKNLPIIELIMKFITINKKLLYKLKSNDFPLHSKIVCSYSVWYFEIIYKHISETKNTNFKRILGKNQNNKTVIKLILEFKNNWYFYLKQVLLCHRFLGNNSRTLRLSENE